MFVVCRRRRARILTTTIWRSVMRTSKRIWCEWKSSGKWHVWCAFCHICSFNRLKFAAHASLTYTHTDTHRTHDSMGLDSPLMFLWHCHIAACVWVRTNDQTLRKITSNWIHFPFDFISFDLPFVSPASSPTQKHNTLARASARCRFLSLLLSHTLSS